MNEQPEFYALSAESQDLLWQILTHAYTHATGFSPDDPDGPDELDIFQQDRVANVAGTIIVEILRQSHGAGEGED